MSKCVQFCQKMWRFIIKYDLVMSRYYHFMKRCLFSGKIVQIVSFHFLGFLFCRDQKMNLKRSPWHLKIGKFCKKCQNGTFGTFYSKLRWHLKTGEIFKKFQNGTFGTWHPRSKNRGWGASFPPIHVKGAHSDLRGFKLSGNPSESKNS